MELHKASDRFGNGGRGHLQFFHVLLYANPHSSIAGPAVVFLVLTKVGKQPSELDVHCIAFFMEHTLVVPADKAGN